METKMLIIDLFYNSPIPSPCLPAGTASERALWGEDNKKANYERRLIKKPRTIAGGGFFSLPVSMLRALPDVDWD
jgi:hypothetical protein